MRYKGFLFYAHLSGEGGWGLVVAKALFPGFSMSCVRIFAYLTDINISKSVT